MSLQVSLQVSLPWELIDSDSSALHKIQTAQICTVIHHIHHIDMGSTYISHTARLKVWRTHTSKTFISSTRRASSRSTVSQQTHRYNRIQDKAERERESQRESCQVRKCLCDWHFLYTHTNLVCEEQTPRTTQNMATSGHQMPYETGIPEPGSIPTPWRKQCIARQVRSLRLDFLNLLDSWSEKKMNQNESIRQPIFIDLH